MSGDVRGELAEALTKMWEADAGEPLDELDVFAETRDAYADALLPVVERIAREAAAEALRKVADELESRHAALNVLGAGATRLNDLLAVEDYLRARADAALGGDR